jgi:hypothetical protein
MLMSVAQIVEEIESLTETDRAAVVRFIESLSAHDSGSSPRYISREGARPIIQKVFQENAELFQKLAQ